MTTRTVYLPPHQYQALEEHRLQVLSRGIAPEAGRTVLAALTASLQAGDIAGHDILLGIYGNSAIPGVTALQSATWDPVRHRVVCDMNIEGRQRTGTIQHGKIPPLTLVFDVWDDEP